MTVDSKALGAAARREVERHKTKLGKQRKRALAIAEVVDRMLVEYEQGRAASSCMAEIRKAAAQ